ncbi:hypothetical protein ACFLZN_02325, partial [Nanoarchaeota archaeon]
LMSDQYDYEAPANVRSMSLLGAGICFGTEKKVLEAQIHQGYLQTFVSRDISIIEGIISIGAEGVTGLCVNHDNSRIAYAYGLNIGLLDSNLEHVTHFSYDGIPTDVAFSPDGKHLIASGKYGIMYLLELDGTDIKDSDILFANRENKDVKTIAWRDNCIAIGEEKTVRTYEVQWQD